MRLDPKKKIHGKQEQSQRTESEVLLVQESASAGAELFTVFQTGCTRGFSMIPAGKNQSDLKKVIRRTSGVRPALFTPDGVFSTLDLNQLDMFDLPAEHDVNKAHQCIGDIAKDFLS